ncbi:MAG: GbsR/MarR family transcriptional regulator [Aquisalinus sp.]|nr:GbsR/MarR family transcriptional regulator [Aquisalinus sp.]
MNIGEKQKAFILHFGEMGSRWGINRTVGQIYALLFLSPHPLNAEDITHKLGLSRSNISMGLKELQSWNLVRLKHLDGDRRDYFTTLEDQWEIIRTLVNERKKREVDPTLTFLREALMEEPANSEDAHAHSRMSEMHELIELLTGWYDDVSRIETERLIQLFKLGSRIQKVIEFKDKFKIIPGGKDVAAEVKD